MRLDQLAARMGDAITIEWKSFMLRPTVQDRPREEFVRYTESWLRPAELEPTAKFTVWASESDPPSHSLPALVAGKVAERHGAPMYDAYHHGLLRAYFTDNRTISDASVQIAIAAEVGIDPVEFTQELTEQQRMSSEAVIDDHNQAVNAGITAVPTVVIAGSLAVPGAQDVDTYERLALRLIERADRS